MAKYYIYVDYDRYDGWMCAQPEPTKKKALQSYCEDYDQTSSGFFIELDLEAKKAETMDKVPTLKVTK